MKKKSQKEQILDALLGGRILTQAHAIDEFRCYRLGARILELREEYNIITETNDKGPQYAKYRLVADGRFF